MAAETNLLAYGDLIARVERTIDAIEVADEPGLVVQRLAQALTEALGEEVGVLGGRVYWREAEHFTLWDTFGEAKEVARGLRVPSTYRPVVLCLAEGTICMEEEDERLDRELEDILGTAAFAAVEVGNGEYLVAFDLVAGRKRQDVLFALALLRYGINQRLRSDHVDDSLRQAREIQQSILPRSIPPFGDFEIAARSDPLETVGGDFYDCIALTDKILGLAMADCSGHGLPAALQVRDVYMGLRMGTSRDFKIVRTVERLNRIIHQSRMTSRFVAMFYGELEIDGTFIYVNAGHPPPYLLRSDGTRRALTEGGMILGPIREATYTRGYLTMEPGDLIVASTDGVLESASDPQSPPSERREYGTRRLLEIVEAHRQLSAAEIVAAVFDDVEQTTGGSPATDDRTVAIVRRPG